LRNIKLAALYELLDISVVTIRKDLKLLEEKALIYRTHGGAFFENPYINEKHLQ
jgi:DeoR family transcriptional regulator of aga operon